MAGKLKYTPPHDDPQRSVRILILVGLTAGLGLPLLLRTCSGNERPQPVECTRLCEGTYNHCAFADRSLCLRECLSNDRSCRAQCTAQPPDCAAHCAAVKSIGCWRDLHNLYGCLLVRCDDPERDLWSECSQALTTYEVCVEQNAVSSPPGLHSRSSSPLF